MCELTDSDFGDHGVPTTNEVFDKKLFEKLCDSHCHPHDDIKNLSMISQLKTRHITIMGVRQDDWDTVSNVALECVHPWFCFRLMVEDKTREEHYKSILRSPKEDEISEIIQELEDPFPYDVWYNNLRQRLLDHPNALVGEVGVDRVAKLLPKGSIEWQGVKPTNVQCTIEHQLKVFEIQSSLARELDRAVSVHCVQGQGHLLNLLKEQSKNYSKRMLKKHNTPFSPLRLCLHSYGGSPTTIQQFLQLAGFKVYISFSVAINARLLPANKLNELIKSVPEDRLLIESDINTPKVMDTCMVEIVRIVAEIRQWPIAKVVQTTHDNWAEFVGVKTSTDDAT